MIDLSSSMLANQLFNLNYIYIVATRHFDLCFLYFTRYVACKLFLRLVYGKVVATHSTQRCRNARGWGVGRKLNSDFVDFSSNQVRAARKSEFNGRVPARRVEEKRIDVPADYIVVFT